MLILSLIFFLLIYTIFDFMISNIYCFLHHFYTNDGSEQFQYSTHATAIHLQIYETSMSESKLAEVMPKSWKQNQNGAQRETIMTQDTLKVHVENTTPKSTPH